jgi:transposase
LARLDRTDAEEDATGKQRAQRLAEKIAALKERRIWHTALLQELDRTGETQISLTDPDSRAMAAHPKVGVGYNAQVAVDAKHKLIVEQQVTNAGSDLGLLAETAGAAKEVLGVERIDAVADKGYYKGEDIQACEDAGISAYVARPQRGSAVRDGLFRKEEFRYDATSDTYHCPGGATLEPRYRSVVDGHSMVHYCNRAACRSCELRPRCTSNTYRRVNRWAGEAVLDRMTDRLAGRPEMLRLRRETVEHPFGSIKQWMNQGYFLMRGLEKVRAEFSLTALAYNFIRVVNLVGVRHLVSAV